MTDTLIEIRNLTAHLQVGREMRPAVEIASCDIFRGEILGLVGESGSGKSMTARSIVRALPPGAQVSGTIRFDGEDMLSCSPERLRTLRAGGIGMIFQEPRAYVDPLWRIEDHVTEGMRVHEGLSARDAHERAVSLLTEVGIRDPERCLKQYPGQLSGGELQRVMIAGAVAGNPALLIADEATTALDVTTQADVIRLIRRLRDELQLSVLFITHDLALAGTICDRIAVMYAGRIVEVGPSATIFDRPQHPYTRALLASRPQLEGERVDRLPTIPGRSCSAMDAPAGCAFHPRCPLADEAAGCMSVVPPLEPHDDGLVACLRADVAVHATGGTR